MKNSAQAVEGSSARRSPNLLSGKEALAATAIGIVAVAGVTGVIGKATDFAADKIFSVWQGAQLERKLDRPYSEVAADVRDGDIDRDEVSQITIREPQTAWSAAQTLVGDGEVGPVAHELSAQAGNQLDPPEQAFVQTDKIQSDNPDPNSLSIDHNDGISPAQ